MVDRRRQFTPSHPEHLGEARRDGGAYSPKLSHADIDQIVGLLSQQNVRDGALTPKDGISLPNASDPAKPTKIVDEKPCAVTNLTVTTGANGNLIWADISWQKGDCANNGAKFEVLLYRSDDPLEANFPESRMTAETKVRFEALEPNTAYEVKVSAVSPINIRSAAATKTFTSSKDTTIPQNVTGLEVTPGLRSVILRWNDVPDGDVINGNGTYEVQIANDPGFTVGVRTVRKNGTVTAFTDLTPATTYYLRVRAVDSSGNTSLAWTTAGAVTTLLAGTQDIAANSVVAEHIVAGSITGDKIQAGSITASQIAADAITAEKLSAITLGVGKFIQSTNYVAGGAGWRINASGSAEFGNAIVRGTVVSNSFQTTSSGARVRMGSALTAADEVQFLGPSGGVGSIRNGEFVLGLSNSMRLSAGGIIDLFFDGSNKCRITAAGGIELSNPTYIGGNVALHSGNVGNYAAPQGHNHGGEYLYPARIWTEMISSFSTLYFQGGAATMSTSGAFSVPSVITGTLLMQGSSGAYRTLRIETQAGIIPLGRFAVTAGGS